MADNQRMSDGDKKLMVDVGQFYLEMDEDIHGAILRALERSLPDEAPQPAPAPARAPLVTSRGRQ